MYALLILLQSVLLIPYSAPSESDGSGSDYSETVREKRIRAGRVHKQAETSTSSSDMTSDEGPHTPDHHKQQSTAVTRSSELHSRVDKGKGRARSPASNVEPSAFSTTLAPKKLGPFSHAAKEEIAMFTDEVMGRADSLATKFGKTRHDILAQAGLGSVKSTRTLNVSNVFWKWYSAHYPKADGSKCFGMQ